MRRLITLASLVVLLLGVPAMSGQHAEQTTGGRHGQQAPDFPPGAFSDGGDYSLSDFRGKVLVLFFYEQDCPTCRGTIPSRNKMVEQFKDKPVKFIAIGPDSAMDVKSYLSDTHLKMPVFIDDLHLMETAYGMKISMNNIYQFRVIGPDGRICDAGIDTAHIASIVDKVKWKYKDDGYDPALSDIVEMLEWNQFVPAMKQLARYRTSSNKTVAASAEKLYQAVKIEGQQWKSDADGAVDANPGQAYDLYTQIVACFPKEDFGVAAADALKKLKSSKPLQNELAARQMYQKLFVAIPKMQFKDKDQVSQYCQMISAQYPDTPTAAKAMGLVKLVEAVPKE